MQLPEHVSHAVAATRNKQTLIRDIFGCSHLSLALYLGYCLALAVAAYLRPLPTYDRYLYAGAVASFRYSDPATIHNIARAEFDSQPSPFQYQGAASDPYFTDVRDNPFHFAEQMGLFRVKLGYVAAGYALWRAGLPILVGLRLISAASLFVVAITILAWTCDALLCSILLLTAPVLNMGRMVTADPLSTMVLFVALFAMTRRRCLLAAVLLLGSIVIRPDNLILVLMLLAWMIWRRHLRFFNGCIVVAVAITISILVNRFAGIYGWRVLMQHGFIKPEIDPISHPVMITFAGYLHALAGLKAIPYTFMTVWALVAVAAWKRLPEGDILRSFLMLAGLFTVIRLLIFPNFDDRFFVWAYLIAGVALMQTARYRVREGEEKLRRL
jgi:hypothetical protein